MDEERRQSLPLPSPVDDSDERRQGVRLRPGAATEPRLEQVVDPARQRLRGAGRNRPGVADDGVALVVPQHELKLGQLVT